ncbi:MAG TPA: ferritin-like domain-containing protein [Mobilitalea sp.]|nr:ferritin-like domain-containing protein [Mobilitalea sp.]
MFSCHCENCSNCESKFCNNVQIPNLPLKGPKPFDQIIHCIHKSIVDEATAIEFYCRLLKEAPNKLNRDFIERALDDEREHLQILTKLYCYYVDKVPEYHVTPVSYPCYKEGLLLALIGELEAVEFYRNMQLYTMDQLIIDTYFLIMVDEQSHATLFSTLFSTCK